MRLQVNSIFITKILSCHNFGIIYYKTRKTSGKFHHLFQYTCLSGGGTGSNDVSLANETFKGTVAGGGRVSLLGMVPGDHSVNNYRSTE